MSEVRSAALSVCVLLAACGGRPRGADGVIAGGPVQVEIGGASWEHKGYRITPLADYLLRARVLHTERYYFDAGADIAPIDLAIGWGPLSDPKIYERYSVSQGGRWARYSAKDRQPPLSYAEVTPNFANMHMIPSTSEVRSRLFRLRRGDLVLIDGFLVLVEGPKGYRWKSSMSRQDSGAGACELVWVRSLDIR